MRLRLGGVDVSSYFSNYVKGDTNANSGIYYFSYCEAAFRAGVIGDQVVVARRRPSLEEADGIPL